MGSNHMDKFSRNLAASLGETRGRTTTAVLVDGLTTTPLDGIASNDPSGFVHVAIGATVIGAWKRPEYRPLIIGLGLLAFAALWTRGQTVG